MHAMLKGKGISPATVTMTKEVTPIDSFLESPRRPLVLPLLSALLLAVSACASSPPPEPKAPVKQAKKADAPEPEPHHVAPPPAYGNKIVMAGAEGEIHSM